MGIRASENGCGFSLLIADREAAFRQQFEGLFRAEGYRTHLAGDDMAVVRIVERERIDVAVLDFELPHAGGVDALRAIRGVVGRRLPCVFTAAEVSGRVQMSALAEDAFSVVPKPVAGDLLRRVVRTALRRYYPWATGSEGS
ncbi:MAG: response regulator [Candidatus Brocadiia bacterium]